MGGKRRKAYLHHIIQADREVKEVEMVVTKNEKNWKFIIDIKLPIATYYEWEIFLRPRAPSDGYDRSTQPGLLCGKRPDLPTEIKASSIKSLEGKINKARTSSLQYRNKCKTMLTDKRKCDYCCDKFMCFTEK